MKKVQVFISAIVVLIILLSVEGCAKKGCTDSKATNYDSSAKDDDGSCEFARDKLIGIYNVIDSSFSSGVFTGNIYNYSITVRKDSSSSSKVLLFNVHEKGKDWYAVVEDNVVTIPSQKLGTGMFEVEVSGLGTFSNNTLRLNYEYASSNYRGTATKQ